jgi:hypothetical protein
MENTAKATLKLVEKELAKFSSYENVKSILSKYSVGAYDKEIVEKLLVILSTEFRRNLEKIASNLPEDDAEASVVVNRRASGSGRGRPKKMEDDIEVIDDFDME